MELEQIRKKIKIIFENERDESTIGYTPKKGVEDIIKFKGKHLIEDPERFKFKAPNVDLLKSLVNRLNTQKERKCFWSELRHTFSPSSHYRDLAPLSFEVMFRMNKIKEAIKLLKKEFRVNRSHLNLLYRLIEDFRFEYNVFDQGLLDAIKTWAGTFLQRTNMRVLRALVLKISGYDSFTEDQLSKPCILEEYVSDIIRLINEIEHSRLKGELLEDVNWEINQDVNKVEEKISLFGLSKELSDGIREIEKEYRQAGSAFDFKTCVDHSRSFLENLNKEIVPKIESKCGIKFSGNITKAKDVIDYFGKKDVDFLMEKEQNLCRDVYGLASDVGVHSLVSKREYARISKNIIVELALLILDRLEKYLSKSSN